MAEPEWADRLGDADRQALSPLFWTHVNSYSRFELDMGNRLNLHPAGVIPGQRADAPRPAPRRRAPGSGRAAVRGRSRQP
nr:transposase [Nonomuraea lactucae]